MSRVLVPRMFVTGSLVGAATAVRAGRRCAGTVARRTPPLLEAAVRATVGEGRAQALYRDQVLALAREAAEVSWRELRRGLEDFDLRTRPAEPSPQRRPYRVKP